MRSGYVDFLQRVADSHSVTRVVHIGDLVDWASISFHEKSPGLSNATHEFDAARRQVATLHRAFPKADWLVGNHDALTERQAVAVGLPPRVLRDYADLWEVGWTVHLRFAKVVIDGVIYAHGDSGRAGQDAALSERMLTNGFVARMLVVESGRHNAGQEPKILDIPPRVLETAAQWASFRPGTGNLEAWHPVPAIVEYTEEARQVFVAGRLECEAEYSRAEQQGDAVGTTVWGRANEHSRKLALLYAISIDHQNPRIDVDAARWGTRFVMHQRSTV